MAEPEDLTVVIPRPLAGRVRAAVDAGDYASTMWSAKRCVSGRNGAREGCTISKRCGPANREGKASGEPRPLDVHRIIQEAGRRMTDRERG